MKDREVGCTTRGVPCRLPQVAFGLVLGVVAASWAPAAELQTDVFATSTQGWGGGSSPTWIATGGPGGVDDGYLQISSFGANFAVFNSDSRWIGNYATAGAVTLSADLRNAPGSDPLEMRAVLFGPASFFERWTSATAVTVPPDGVWRNYQFTLDEASLARVLGSSSFDAMFADVARVMLRHDPGNPSSVGTGVAATLGIDNITLAGAQPLLEADFNGDGAVNGLDLARWEGAFGVDGSADATGDGVSAGEDFLVWQRQVGTSSATIALQSIPEPTAASLMGSVAAIWGVARRRRR
jgi:hypothetical protein